MVEICDSSKFLLFPAVLDLLLLLLLWALLDQGYIILSLYFMWLIYQNILLFYNNILDKCILKLLK